MPQNSLAEVHKSFPYATGACRELVGGITFELFSRDNTELGDVTLRFTARLGCSMLQVQPFPVLDLGSTVVGKVVEGTVSLSNGTSLLGLPFSVSASSDRVQVLTNSVGTLGGRDTAGKKGQKGPLGAVSYTHLTLPTICSV